MKENNQYTQKDNHNTSRKILNKICKNYEDFTKRIIIELLDIDSSCIESSTYTNEDLPIISSSKNRMAIDLILSECHEEYYAYRIILNDKKIAEKYKECNLNQIIFINNRPDLSEGEFINALTFRNVKTNELMPYAPQIICVSLDNINKLAHDESHKWLYKALKIITSSIDEAKTLASNDKTLEKVVDFLEDYSINNS